jgi:hypothetical protein
MTRNPANLLSDNEEKIAETYNIRVEHFKYFYVGSYRYTKLSDAVAEAERQMKVADVD